MALNAALGGMLYTINGKWWQNGQDNTVAASFMINATNVFVNTCYMNDTAVTDYIVWCYYR